VIKHTGHNSVVLTSVWNMVMGDGYKWFKVGVHGDSLRLATAFSTELEVDMVVAFLSS